jgi:hypothetical protein
MAPRQIWPAIWKVRDAGVIASFLQHPKLGLDHVVALIQPPLLPTHLDALSASKWRAACPVAFQVLDAMDKSFQFPEPPIVLGQAAPWIKVLSEEERVLAASRMTHPPLRLMTRAGRSPTQAPG